MAAKPERLPRKRFKSHFRIYLGDEIALGPGKADLLHHISETGSISEAARRMDMSYNRAWLLVRTMNRSFKEPLVLASRGGDSRGGPGRSTTDHDQIRHGGDRHLATGLGDILRRGSHGTAP